jgi:acyl-CoA thioesterase-1
MALPPAQAILASALIALVGSASTGAQSPQAPPEALDTVLSPECRVPGVRLYRLAPLPAVGAVLRQKRALKVLALGSAGAASSFGSGAGAAHSDRLQDELEKVLPGISIEVEQRGLPGDLTADAVERISATVADVQPDLVVWQVGTNDALAKADLDAFSGAVNEILEWLRSHDIDVVLIEPPYAAALADDEHYKGLISAIQKSARDNRVPLVLRFEAMEFLGRETEGRPRMSAFLLNELGARCLAEHVARTVALSLLESPAQR